MKFRVKLHKEGIPDEIKTIDAPSRFAVYDLVREQGSVVVSIKERPAFDLFSLLEKVNISFGTGIKRAEIIRMAKNLSTMLGAGLSVSRSLAVIERQSNNKSLHRVTTGLVDAIKKGSAFHEALALYPRVFPPIFIAMAKAGEESGSLADALSTIALQLGRADELVRKVKGAMIYPAIVISGVVIVAILMLMFVVPTLTTTFKSLKVELPMATRIIVAISDFLTNHAVLVAPILIAFVVGMIMLLRTRPGARAVLWSSLHTPVIGDIVRETYSARAARTLASLLASGVPVVNALEITRDVVHAEAFAAVVTEASEHVKKGDPLSKAFLDHPDLYPVLMSDMLSVGEETGKVAEMLKQIAEFYEETVSEKTKDLSTIIEPVLMLIIGAFVGVFAVAMIGPIYSLSSAF